MGMDRNMGIGMSRYMDRNMDKGMDRYMDIDTGRKHEQGHHDSRIGIFDFL
jgi:hypothetical protein